MARRADRPLTAGDVLPAVDGEHGAGHEGGVVGGEEGDERGDFLGLAEAADRDLRR